MERTLVLLKPDAMQTRLEEHILWRYENAGLKIISRKIVRADKLLLQKHYFAHANKSFYPGLEKFMMEAPVLAVVLEGENAVKRVREITGSTDPSKAAKGTVRGDLSTDSGEKADAEKRAIRNLVHASGNAEEAAFEISLWFPELKRGS